MKYKVFCAFLLIPMFLFADVKPASIIGDNAVFQAHSPFRIWGTADVGEKVKVSFLGKSLQTVTGKDGKWMLEFPASNYVKEGKELLIEGKNKISYKNILVGEVWLLSGQSNMDFPLAYVTGGRELINEPENPLIRFFNIQEEPRGIAYDCNGLEREKIFWRTADSKSRERMSALGVLVGNRLFKELNVPIALINASYGGSEIQTWLTEDAAKASGEEKWLEWAQTRQKNWNKKDIDAWEAMGQEERKAKNKLNKPNADKGLVSSCYNAKISAIEPFAIKGELWYQGEGNAGQSQAYFNLFKAYAQQMRTNFKNPKMPIFTVQLPDFNNKDWPSMRNVQRKIALEIPNCFMVVSIDGHEIDLHPRNKNVLGKRLAELVLSEIYHKDYQAKSPIQVKAALEKDSSVKLKFFDVYDGLKTSDNAAPKGFELSEDGKTFTPCEAKITGKNELTLSCPKEISKPNFVRYAWAADPDVNLQNSAGLPVSPFQEELK